MAMSSRFFVVVGLIVGASALPRAQDRQPVTRQPAFPRGSARVACTLDGSGQRRNELMVVQASRPANAAGLKPRTTYGGCVHESSVTYSRAHRRCGRTRCG